MSAGLETAIKVVGVCGGIIAAGLGMTTFGNSVVGRADQAAQRVEDRVEKRLDRIEGKVDDVLKHVREDDR